MKIKNKKELDNYLRTIQDKISDATTLEEIKSILEEQNKVLEEWIKYKCEEIGNAE